eukprot:symbB.v1.2.004904.t1/scaffold263.1/size248082/5
MDSILSRTVDFLRSSIMPLSSSRLQRRSLLFCCAMPLAVRTIPNGLNGRLLPLVMAFRASPFLIQGHRFNSRPADVSFAGGSRHRRVQATLMLCRLRACPGLRRPRSSLHRRQARSNTGEAKPTERVWHLPEWAKQETRPPLQLRLLGFTLLVPLGSGSLAVHLLADEDQESEREDYSRLALNWSLHYAGALLSCAGALHWGMQLAELGVPKRSDFMGLYYLCRFSGPAVFVFFGWLGSVLTTALPVEASLWLLTGFTGLLSTDFLAGAFRVAPAYWFRWRAAFNLSAIGCILVLLLSERNLYLGQKPKIRMFRLHESKTSDAADLERPCVASNTLSSWKRGRIAKVDVSFGFGLFPFSLQLKEVQNQWHTGD